MNKKINFTRIVNIFRKHCEIKLAYIFGSQIDGEAGPLSDYDFAVYVNLTNIKKIFDLKFVVHNELCQILKTDKVDLVILNLTKNSIIKYQIIKSGKLIYEVEPYKLLIEPKILNEYFDYSYLMKKNLLTKAK